MDNRAADALSRRSVVGQQVLAISESQPIWLQQVAASYSTDHFTQNIIQKMVLDSSAYPKFQLKEGILRKQGRIWVGSDPVLQAKIVQSLHDSALGGHSGFPVTHRRIAQLFAWKGMKLFVKNWVKSCSTCQQAKPERVMYPGLLKPLPTPDGVWDIVSMDFIEGLPLSGKFNCILVVIDSLSKFGHFIPLCHPFTVTTVAEAFMDTVFRLHGMPLSIISDRDRIFTSKFWTELFRLSDTQLRMSTSYHPQTDGQTERVNQSVSVFSVVSPMLTPLDGLNGCLCVSSGTTTIGIRLWGKHHFRLFMAALLGSLALFLWMQLLLLIWNSGSLIDLSSWLRFSNTSSAPNRE